MGSGDYSKAGPYTVATKAGVDLSGTGDLPTGDAGVSTGTIFYPSDLSGDCPHPIVSWANGTTVSGSQVYGFFNNNAASWGIVVMAADNPNSAGGTTTGPYNRAGIDYLLKENNDSSSIFYHHLSTRAGVAGHSQGAFAATLATQHPNVEAEVQVEGGGVPKAGIAFLALTGSDDTVVGTMAPMASYMSATGPSMFAEYTGADHTTTPTIAGYLQMNPGIIQFMRFYTAWWRCFLADDQVACKMFKGGSSCGVCKDPNWTSLETKNM
jgi:pimeloyl-ACP methyl ester carboxylesterase